VLKSAPPVKVIEEITFVRLVPTDLVRGHWANVQTIDVWGVDECLDQFRIARNRANRQARTEQVQQLCLGGFDYGGKREKVFTRRQRVVRVTTDYGWS
jgi:hypothetical protein